MKIDGVFVDTVGVYLPQEWISIDRAVSEGLYDAYSIKYGTGLTAAYMGGDTPALDMAVSAATQAIERSEVEVADLDYLVHCSATPQGPQGFYAPGYVLRELGASGVASMDVRHHSNGLLAGLEVALGQLTGAAGADTVLVTAAENFTSPMIDRWQGFGTGFTASDGGAAMLLSGTSGFAAVRALNSGTLAELEQWHRGDAPLLMSQGPVIGDTMSMLSYFNENVLPLDKCMEMMRDFEVEVIHRSLVDTGLNAADLRWVIAANSDARMIEQMKMQPLGLPMSRSTWDIGKEYGHMGACDMAVLLNHLMTNGQLEVGDHVLMSTSAAGWVTTSAVMTIVDMPSWSRTAPAA